MAYTVSEVAGLARVSVRTLHHYDAIGLLEPSSRSDGGYRLYGDADLERLQEILFFRELGFPLESIARMIDDPAADRRETLLVQREMLAEKAARLSAMVRTLDRTIAAMDEGTGMTTEEMFEVFGDFDPTEYGAEVQERWGDTDAYRESARRTARYTKADWQRFKEESEANTLRIVELMDEGVPADDPRAMDAVDEARLLIDRWFYPCSRRMHAELGAMYVADPRFTATYEKIRPGLAQYMHDATAANARRDG